MSWTDLSGILETFKIVGGLSVVRRSAGTFENGFYTASAPVQFNIDPIAAYPASTRDLMVLPEGLRMERVVAFLTREELRCTNEPNGGMPDQIIYENTTYEVKIVESWQSNANYFKVLAVRIPQELAVA